MVMGRLVGKKTGITVVEDVVLVVEFPVVVLVGVVVVVGTGFTMGYWVGGIGA